MCYDKAYLAKKQEKYANRYAVHVSEVEHLNRIKPGTCVSCIGF